ncbi:glycerate kinase [Allopusillimonas soli]|uniref:Glycerate kinase n=1 Tax=Allopusillimonas soli TaxID=659016 RepID=A0A853FHD2_9BURK|nr:glycerate kinase [Allopusillimonas soli]NYT37851.1 glycerate kinase [Allopusillimonas soli]TEA73755.1 glycerate kinase [Allopusillimonas soli]
MKSAPPFIPRELLARMFAAAVEAAQPARCLPPFLPAQPRGRTLVIGAGKASAAMARVVEDHWAGPLEGLVVTRYGHAVPCRHIEIVEAAHPVPDSAGTEAARRMLAMLHDLTPDDLVIGLFSGGGSSLLSLPAEGIALHDKQAINRALLKSGANISEMNCVRRHLSAIKGGRLAAACHPARVLNLLISDVPGDQAADIASGPTTTDHTSCADALDIVRRYGIDLPDAARQLLESGAGETIKSNDGRVSGVETHLIATAQHALAAAAAVAQKAGVRSLVLGDRIEGEAREVGKVMAGIALQTHAHHQPVKPPCVLLSGGETTVTVRGQGRGGRNVEFLLSLAVALNGASGIHAVAGDTDGVDGQEERAGAFIGPDTLARALEYGLRPRHSLENNDGHGFFEALDDALITGPTLTNVNDFRAILVL